MYTTSIALLQDDESSLSHATKSHRNCTLYIGASLRDSVWYEASIR